MSEFNYMPLTGAVLISNPRRGTTMAARSNPNYYRRMFRDARSTASQRRQLARKKLRTKFRKLGGVNWAQKKALKSRYNKEAERAGVSVASMVTHVKRKTTSPAAAKRRASALRRKHDSWARKYKIKTWPKSSRNRGAAYNYKPFRRDAQGRFTKGSRKVIRASNRRNLKMRTTQMAGFQVTNSRTGKGRYRKSYRPVGAKYGHPSTRTFDRKRKGAAKRRGATRRSRAGAAASRLRDSRGRFVKAGSRTRPTGRRKTTKRGRKGLGKNWYTKLTREEKTNYNAIRARLEDQGGYNASEIKAMAYRQAVTRARTNGLALINPLALINGIAVDNPLALINGIAFRNGVAGLTLSGVGDSTVDALKMAGGGIIGAVGYYYAIPFIEEGISKIPVVGDYLLDVSVPDAVPFIGGADLSKGVIGALGGTAVAVASALIGHYSGIAAIAQYGVGIGGGIATIGGVLTGLDFLEEMSSDDDATSDMGDLALTNFGALAMGGDISQEFGDGMAYQLGGIASGGDDYGQASLGDAYYSGADFSLGEGQALLNGKHGYQRRFGRPTHRVARHGGRSAGPSHMAGQQGHRWGWLVKMLGWEAASQVARQSPNQRVKTIAALRANALATLKQIQETAQLEQLASPEFAPVHSTARIPQGHLQQYAHTGAQGVGSNFGSTIFAGQGL